MRSRPDLELSIEPAVIVPGTRIRATAHMTSHAATPCNGVTMRLHGTEQRFHRTRKTQHGSRRIYHTRDVCLLEAKFDAFELTPGAHERMARFEIPEWAPPTYESELSTIAYALEVRVDIPWWPDRVKTYMVPVSHRSTAPEQTEPRRFASRDAPKGKELFLEASLSSQAVALGGRLEGAVSLANVAYHRIRDVRVALVGIETARVESTRGPDEVERTTWIIHEGKPAEGESIRFAIDVPTQHRPSFETDFLTLTHALEVRATIAFGVDATIWIPLRLHRAEPEKEARDARPVAVGAERREGNWGRVLRRIPPFATVVSVDEAADDCVLTAAGARIHITAEHRGKQGAHLVASLEWPSLGLGLRLAERQWQFLGRGRSAGALERRFVIQAREPAQLESFFTEPVRRFVDGFAEVGVDDQGAVVATPGSSHSAPALRAFVTKAVELASAMAGAAKTVEPPRALAPSLKAYRAFAKKRGCRLTRGDLSLSEIDARGVRIGLRHRFEGVEAKESVVFADIGGATMPDGFEAEATKALEKRVVIADGRVNVWMPVVADPLGIEPLVDALGDIVANGGRIRAIGPYR